MIKKALLNAAIAASLLVSMQVNADTNPDRGPYYGVEALLARHDVNTSDLNRNFSVEDPSATRVDNDASGYAVYGGYRFFKYLAIDGGLLALGAPKVHIGYHTVQVCSAGTTTVTCVATRTAPRDIANSKSGGVRVRATGSWPLGDRWSIDGRLGLAIIGNGGDSSSVASVFGVGASGRVYRSFLVRMFWDRVSEAGQNAEPVDALSLGLAYQF